VKRSAYDDRDLESFPFRIRLGFGRLNGAYWIRPRERAFEALVQPIVNFLVSFLCLFWINGVLWPSGPSFGTNTPRPNGPTLGTEAGSRGYQMYLRSGELCERTGS